MLIYFVCYIIEKSNGTMVQWYFTFDFAYMYQRTIVPFEYLII